MSMRDEIRAAMAITAAGKIIPVPNIEGWPALFVKAPTVAEVDVASTLDAQEVEDNKKAEEATKAGKPAGEIKKRRFARGACNLICDASGNRLFDPANEEDVDLLAAQPWDMLQKVMAAADTKSPGTDAEGN